jgi:hypothetical protein
MVTTLIAQMSDLRAPISKSTMRTCRPVPMGLCAVSHWCEVRNKGKAQLSSALERISEWITWLSKPCPAQKQPEGQPTENKHNFIFQQDGGERVSHLPLKNKAFLTFLDQNPPLELRPENGILPSTKVCPAQWPVIDDSVIERLAKANCRRTAQPEAWAFALRRQRSHVRIVSGAPLHDFVRFRRRGLPAAVECRTSSPQLCRRSSAARPRRRWLLQST